MEAHEHDPNAPHDPHDHSATPRGRAFLYGGIGLGLLAVLLLVTHGFGLWGGHGAEPEKPQLVHQGAKIFVPEGSPLRDRLTVAPAAAEPVSGKLTLPGVVESDPARTAAVLPALGGRVVELKVALGQRVQRDQPLAVIDSPDLGQAWDDDDKAADALNLTKKNLGRQEEQFKIGAASQHDLDQARSDNKQALAEYTRTQARLKSIGASAEGSGHSRLLTVRAPFAGSITALSVASGNMINDPTQPIMTVADLSVVWVTALVPEKDLASVAADQPAQVTLTAYPGRTWRGKVLFVADVLDADSRRTQTRIAFSNADYALKPNMFASVTLEGPQLQRVVVPSSALLMNNDRTTVFVATAPWTFERRTVEPLLEDSTTVAISSGIRPGEQVVVKGGILLND
jgi:cobalt-zinc-cadmium efflux system membrane fusion protein